MVQTLSRSRVRSKVKQWLWYEVWYMWRIVHIGKWEAQNEIKGFEFESR